MIRRGAGVREARWAINDANRVDRLADEIVDWVRSSMGEMRRPYGIDQIALALSCRDDLGNVVGCESLGILRPESFYRAEGGHRIATFLHGVCKPAASTPAVVGAALLSIGDLAYEMGAARAA